MCKGIFGLFWGISWKKEEKIGNEARENKVM